MACQSISKASNHKIAGSAFSAILNGTHARRRVALAEQRVLGVVVRTGRAARSAHAHRAMASRALLSCRCGRRARWSRRRGRGAPHTCQCRPEPRTASCGEAAGGALRLSANPAPTRRRTRRRTSGDKYSRRHARGKFQRPTKTTCSTHGPSVHILQATRRRDALESSALNAATVASMAAAAPDGHP